MDISVDANSSRLVIANYADQRSVPELKVTRYNKVVGFILEKLGYAVALSYNNKTFYANKLSIGREYVQKVKHSLDDQGKPITGAIDDKVKRVGYEEFLRCSRLSKEKIEERKQEAAFVSAVNRQAEPNIDYHRLAKDLNAALFEGQHDEIIQLLTLMQLNFARFPQSKSPGQTMTISEQLGDFANKLRNQKDDSFPTELWDFSRQLLKITEDTEYSSWHS